MPTHRGHNEGHIRHRVDGRWEAQLSLGDGSRKSFYGKTRQEVARKLNQARRDLDQGLPIIRDERQTLATFLDSWLLIIASSIEAGSLESYRQAVEKHISPALGAIRLNQLTAQHIQEFYALKTASGLANTTVRRLGATLHRALWSAQRLGLVQRNVSSLVTAPRRNKSEMRVFSYNEARRFIEASRGTRDEALFITAILTGMRQGELLALRWRDVDLNAGRVSVQSSLQHKQVTGVWVMKRPKTQRSRRQIALAIPVLMALRTHQERQLEQRKQLGEAWQDNDLVFPSEIGTPAFAANVHYRFVKFLERSGLPRIRFHDLRHTCATLLLLKRVHPKVVSEMLGHSNIAMTLDLYSHVLPDMQQDAAAALDDLMVSESKEGGDGEKH